MENSIPKISPERIENLLEKIRPVGRFIITDENNLELSEKDGSLYFMKPKDDRNMSYDCNIRVERPANDINPIPYKVVETKHQCGGMRFFPTLAEILAQIPEDELSRTVGFSTEFSHTEGQIDFGKTSLYKR